jgi:nucleotide-binding universal stress UspA family protein
VVLAAVDVAAGANAALNARIVRTAAAFVHPSIQGLNVVHAWSITAESVLECPLRGIDRAQIWALRRWTRAERRRRLEALVAAEVRDRPVRIFLERGRPGAVVRRAATRLGAGLVVLGAVEPRPMPGLVISSMAEALAGGRDYSVLLVRSGTRLATAAPVNSG